MIWLQKGETGLLVYGAYHAMLKTNSNIYIKTYIYLKSSRKKAA